MGQDLLAEGITFDPNNFQQTDISMSISNYSKPRVGVLGGGQLGRMLLQEAINLDIELAMLDPSAQAPCAHLAPKFYMGDFKDHEEVMLMGLKTDVLTIEIEHVNVQALEDLEKQGRRVAPSSSIVRTVQDKGLQKQFYDQNDIPTAPYSLVASKEELAGRSFPYVLKMRKGGYDGKGVAVIKNDQDLAEAFDGSCVVEEMIDFDKELSIIVARNRSGEIKTFPVVEMEFNPKANLVEFLLSPAQVNEAVNEKAEKIAHQLADSLQLEGILAIELFLTKNGELMVNEVAPRPHNSGHQTIEGNFTSQYGQHLRAILNMPLGSTKAIMPSAMINILGEPNHAGAAAYQGLEEALKMEGVYPHIYGKTQVKPFRKMGHVTVIAPTVEEVKEKAMRVKEILKAVSA